MYKQLHSHPRIVAVRIVSLPALPIVLELIYAGRHCQTRRKWKTLLGQVRTARNRSRVACLLLWMWNAL